MTVPPRVADPLNGVLTVRGKRSKVAVMLLLGIALTVLCTVLLTTQQTYGQKPLWLLHAAGAAGTLLFGLATLRALVMLAKGVPDLVLDRDGIDIPNIGRIRWRDVNSVRAVSIRCSKLIILDLDVSKVPSGRARVWRRFLLAANRLTVGGPVALSVGTLDIGFDELLAAIGRYVAEARHGGRAGDVDGRASTGLGPASDGVTRLFRRPLRRS